MCFYLSIFPAMGQSSVSANCLQVSFSIEWVSGKSVSVAAVELDLQLSRGEHLFTADVSKTRPIIDVIAVSMIKTWKDLNQFNWQLTTQKFLLEFEKNKQPIANRGIGYLVFNNFLTNSCQKELSLTMILSLIFLYSTFWWLLYKYFILKNDI